MSIYKVVELSEVAKTIDYLQKVGCDLETDGFYGTVELAQFYQADWPQVLLVRKPNPYELAVLLAKCDLLGHNLIYDFSTIQDCTDTSWTPERWDDTFYLARLFYYNKERFTLDQTLTYVLGFDPYAEAGLNKKALQDSDWSSLLTPSQKLYAALDVFHLFDVWEKVKDQVDDFNYKLDIIFANICMGFQKNGMPVENQKVQDMFERNLAEAESYNLPINVNSWQQVRPYIGESDSDALALATFTIQGNKRAEEVNIVRKLLKQNSFLKKFDTQEGRIFGHFSPSARSGRATCKLQNLEQLPRKTKDVFGVDPESGRILTYADYAQLELRGACVITAERRMEKLFRAGEDLHSYTAKMLFGENYTKEQRQIAKTANFNLLYGGGHRMLGSILIKEAGILLTERELKAIKAKWLNLWSSINKWQQEEIKRWRRGQSGETPLGRRYVGKLMTDHLNIKVQGFGAEISKLASHYMTERLENAGIHNDVMLCNFIHDSWIFEHDNDEELNNKVAYSVADAMQESWQNCSKLTNITDLPMPVEVFQGYNWGDIESGKYINYIEVA